MSAAEPAQPLQMTQFVDRNNPQLTGQETGAIGRLFKVAPSQVRLLPHPQNDDRSALSIGFRHGINIAAALASYFNRELYQIPRHERVRDLAFKTNGYAYIDTHAPGEVLCLSIGEPVDTFLNRLKEREADIRYVMDNPQILFMMRPDIDYRTARLNLQRGHRAQL
jgi:hypothetical protein